jgi:predicted DNA binding protein
MKSDMVLSTFKIVSEHKDWSRNTETYPMMVEHLCFTPNVRKNVYRTYLKVFGNVKHVRGFYASLKSESTVYQVSARPLNMTQTYLSFSGKFSETLYSSLFKKGIFDYLCVVEHGLESWYFVSTFDEFLDIKQEFKKKSSILENKEMSVAIDSIKFYYYISYYFTDNEKDILNYAIRYGYYSVPRKIIEQDIAEHFDISLNMVNKTLRKSISKLFQEIHK